MAFDGITMANLAFELNEQLKDGGISRVIQPEKDELYLTIKSHRKTYILYISASASLPLIYLTDETPKAPLTAPNFCMLLRKHLQSGQIVGIYQPSLERVLELRIQHANELGDPVIRKLMIEIMGKYSNIILTDEHDVIIDSIKRVPSTMSSVREVLPGRPYFIPETQDKENPLTADEAAFLKAVCGKPSEIGRASCRERV